MFKVPSSSSQDVETRSRPSRHPPPLSRRPRALGREQHFTVKESRDVGGEMTESPKAGSESSRGFEPEGSIDDSTPYSESGGTPPYLRWAEDIQNLLGDAEGVKLYQSYLEQESLGHLLKFWFACEGLKKQEDEKTVIKYIKVINKNFISSQVLTLGDAVKTGISDKLNSKVGVDQNIFDKAQEQVRELMIQTTYPNFLKSDVYLNYIQIVQNRDGEIKTGSHSSSSSVSGRGTASNLPTGSQPSIDEFSNNPPISETTSGISEGTVTTTNSGSAPIDSVMPAEPPFLGYSGNHGGGGGGLPTLHENSELNLAESSNLATVSLTKEALLSTQKRRLGDHSSLTGGSDTQISFPYHAYGSAYNPVSRQDSELQSQSSGGLGDTTTDDNYSSFTEGSSLAMAERISKRNRHRQKVERKRIQENVRRNKEDHHKTIPRPNRMGQTPPNPMSPREFAEILSKRLQNYLDQQTREKNSFELLNRKLNIIESSDSTRIPNTTNDLESDQSILDEHVSRIWQDKTPVHLRSPGDVAGRPRSPNTLGRSGKSSGKYNPQQQYKTLPNRRNPPPPSSYFPTSSGIPVGFQQRHEHVDASSYRHSSLSGAPHPIAGDLAYYNPSVHKSYSGDLDFRRPPPQPQHMSTSLGPHHPGGGSDRVMEWVQTVNTAPTGILYGEDDQRSSRSGMKTSPKSSRSHHHHRNRARSQDRVHNHSWVHSSHSSTHQQLQEVNRRLILNQSSSNSNKSGTLISTVTYTFSNEPEGMPYRVKIPGTDGIVTLKQVKDNLPKIGRYRFYFKTKVDGEPCFEEERDNSAYVPLWDEGKIIVQCRDDLV